MAILLLGPGRSRGDEEGWAKISPGGDPWRPVLAGLKRQTGVPILLPTTLPRGASETLYVSATGGQDRYSVELGSLPGCDANSCFVASFSAERGGRSYMVNPRRISLAGHHEARFGARSCGGSCSGPAIDWNLDGVLYSIEIHFDHDDDDAQAARVLQGLVESAIAAGPR
jgi:hypothetical protein